MPVACRNRNQTATNPLHLCKTVDKEKRRCFVMIQWEVPQKGLRRLDSCYTGIYLLVNSTNYVNFLTTDLFWSNIKMGIVVV